MYTDKSQKNECRLTYGIESTLTFLKEIVFLVSLIRVHPCESVAPIRSVPLRLCGRRKNRGERSIPGCGAGMESLCRVAWRRNRGDERRHIASAHHRGSEGAPAISVNPSLLPLA